jgi:hypothetical protein
VVHLNDSGVEVAENGEDAAVVGVGRVDRVRRPGQGVDELADVGDTVLQQVADTVAAAGEKLCGVMVFDVAVSQREGPSDVFRASLPVFS